MSKELPYFRFYPAEYLNGDISLESAQLNGVFIIVCSYYWCEDCYVFKQKLYKKYKKYIKNIEKLISLEIIKFDKQTDLITIKFLDVQLIELGKERKSLSDRGKKGVEAKAEKKKQAVEFETKPQAEVKLSLSYKDNNKDKDKRSVVKTTSLYKLFVEHYALFYKKQTSIKYKFKTVDGKAYKLLIEAFINTAGEAKALAGWNYVLSNWELLDKYYSQKIKPMEIYSELGNIMKQIKESKKPFKNKNIYQGNIKEELIKSKKNE